MKLVLLSGGSGKRLWPLSNESRSKQFLKVLKNDSGEMESMVQRVWRQLEWSGLRQHAVIATGKGQVDMIRNQLGDNVPIVVEPERRDTFPAIALAATYLYSIAGLSLHETVAVLPVDPYVENRFFHVLQSLEAALQQTGAELALIGVKPTYPAEKYGYIIPEAETGKADAGFWPIKTFMEKPNSRRAANMIAQGALWNCGVFAFRLEFLINHLEKSGYPLSYDALSRKYAALPKNSFDYEVVEKTERLVVVPYDGAWKDLGTWNTLTEEMEERTIGNAWIGENAAESHVINELGIPVALIGIPNAVVAAGHDGILVADKSSSHQVKNFLREFVQRPMYEELKWGSCKVLDYRKYEDGSEMLAKLLCVAAGCHLSYHLHAKHNEVWTILSGEGAVILNEHEMLVKPGDTIRIPAGMRHALKANARLEMIEVQQGAQLADSDMVEITAEWSSIARTDLAYHSLNNKR